MYRCTPHYFVLTKQALSSDDLKQKVKDKIVNRYLLEAEQGENDADFNFK